MSKKREVELVRLWDDNTWDTDTHDFPKKVVEDAEKTGDYQQIEKLYRRVMLKGISKKYSLVAFYVFHIPPADE